MASAVLVWTLSRGATPVPLARWHSLFAVFGALVAWHARVDARVAWHDALKLVNVRAQFHAGRATGRRCPTPMCLRAST